MHARFIWQALVPLLALAAVGCSGAGRDGPTGTVSGKVLVGGRVVTAGQINFFSADQQHSGVGMIKPDGTYTVSNAPMGKDKVTISVPAPTGARAPKSLMASAAPAPVAVPGRYRNVTTTDINVDVTARTQTFDITLKDR